MNYSKLKNKVVIITGASSGIGLALVERFAGYDCRTVLASTNISKLNEIREKLNAEGKTCLVVQTDVSSEDQCKRLIIKTIDTFGRIDILVNNAGISMRSLFADLDTVVIRKVMDVNFWGAVYCTKYALPYILESDGSIIAVSSMAGFKGLPARVGYSASKFALHGLMETIRIEHLKKNLHVMIAAPWFTRTNIRNVALNGKGNPQGESPRDERKHMSAERVAKIIVRGTLRKRRTLYINLKGILFVLFNHFLPARLDKIIYRGLSKEKDSPIS